MMRYGEPEPQAAPAGENQKQGLRPGRTRSNSLDRRKAAPFNRRQQQRLARAKEAKELPDVREMLRTIDRRLREDEGKADKPETVFGEHSYFAIYGITSMPTHGHILALGKQANEATVRFISAATVQAAFLLVRAVHYALRWDTEQLSQKVLRILQDDPQPDRSIKEE